MRRALRLLPLLVLAAPRVAGATAPGTFGTGPRSEALSQADLAVGDPTVAAQINPALASAPGVTWRFGWSYTGIDARVSGVRTGLRELHGLDMAAAAGVKLAAWFDVGGGMVIHLPDQGLAALTFRPAHEPQLVRFGADLERATFDAVVAVRIGPIHVGGGASVAVGVAGDGADFRMGSQAGSAYALGAVDLTLPYRVAPVVGIKADIGPVRLAIAARGGMGIDLTLPSAVRIDLGGFPLDGRNDVFVRGVSGYDPTRATFGAAVTPIPALTIAAAFEYLVWSAAPSFAADVKLDVALGTVPGDRVVDYGLPKLRDTIAPRVGIEGIVRGAPSNPFELGRIAVRGGYHASPSPLPPQKGFASYADADRHAFTFGAGFGLGKPLGVHLAASVAGQVHVLPERVFTKDDPALPNAHYAVDGVVGRGSIAVEGAFK